MWQFNLWLPLPPVTKQIPQWSWFLSKKSYRVISPWSWIMILLESCHLYLRFLLWYYTISPGFWHYVDVVWNIAESSLICFMHIWLEYVLKVPTWLKDICTMDNEISQGHQSVLPPPPHPGVKWVACLRCILTEYINVDLQFFKGKMTRLSDDWPYCTVTAVLYSSDFILYFS